MNPSLPIPLGARMARFAIALTVAATTPLVAQEHDRVAGPEIFGPAPPTGDAVINQAGDGGATIRAVRVAEPLLIDGVIDESFYSETTAITEFFQSVPVENGEPSERTEVWIAFDDRNVYVSARIWDSVGPDGWIANEMRRDSPQLRLNDNFGIWFDTFYDRRNSVGFYGNAIGGLSDFQITNEGNPNFDWNPVRESRTAIFDGGWSFELAVPFKSLRYRPGREQVWGVQLRRSVLRRNEWHHITALPLSVTGNGSQAVFRVSMYATLVGIEAPPPSRNLEVKPYGISGLETDHTLDPRVDNDGYADWGLDVKYGITANLTADLTYNTDFAQVEVDEQQVNLTRFSLFYPEKRDFFLESRGIFNFGQGSIGGGGGAFSGGGGGGRGGAAPTLFYSRRIGLDSGEPVPIVGGGRVTGKVGSFDVGLVNIQTDDEASVGAESTNFSVVRLRRDLLERSSVGLMYENRSRSTVADGANHAWGVDGSFGLTDEISMVTYYAQTRTEGLGGMDASYRGRFSYNADEWGADVDHLVVGADFNPEVGFVRRDDFRQTSLTGRFSPRTNSVSWLRQVTLQGDADYLESESLGLVESRSWSGRVGLDLENSDQLTVGFTESYENLFTDETISGITIPAGRYTFPEWELGYTFGPQRRVTGNVALRLGDYYDGTLTTLGFNRGRIEITPQLSLEPSLSLNWIDLPQATIDQHVLVSRLTYTITPRAYVSGLVQYNSGSETVSGNFRLRWEWAPGSELFVVYTEDRDTGILDRWSELETRGLVVKVTRLFRP